MEAQRRANLAEIAKILQGTRPIDVGVLYSFAHTEQSVVQRGLGLYSSAFHCWVSSNEHLENNNPKFDLGHKPPKQHIPSTTSSIDRLLTSAPLPFALQFAHLPFLCLPILWWFYLHVVWDCAIQGCLWGINTTQQCETNNHVFVIASTHKTSQAHLIQSSTNSTLHNYLVSVVVWTPIVSSSEMEVTPHFRTFLPKFMPHVRRKFV